MYRNNKHQSTAVFPEASLNNDELYFNYLFYSILINNTIYNIV